ncbi:MAG: hypothetical protein JNL49_15270 [Bacteroidia bacterium]|nr:hypothetical protein [Bacteroidia bacterium]
MKINNIADIAPCASLLSMGFILGCSANVTAKASGIRQLPIGQLLIKICRMNAGNNNMPVHENGNEQPLMAERKVVSLVKMLKALEK